MFGGWFFCIFCVFFGILLNLVVFKIVGEWIIWYIYNIIKYIEKMYFRWKYFFYVGIKLVVVLFMMMVFVILVGGVLDMIFDGWIFFDGVYFNFIVYSIIGFGDLFLWVEKFVKFDKFGLGESGKCLFVMFIMLIFMIVGLFMMLFVICFILNVIEEMLWVFVIWRSWLFIFSKNNLVNLKSIKK